MIKIDFNPRDKQLSQFGWIALFGFPLIGFMIAWNFMSLPLLFFILTFKRHIAEKTGGAKTAPTAAAE